MNREEWRTRAIKHGTELRKVKEQLEIAVKALEIYADKTNWDNHFTFKINNYKIEVITFIEGTDKDGEFYAEKALKKIKKIEDKYNEL